MGKKYKCGSFNRVELFSKFLLFLILLSTPSHVFAANNDPFRGGREAVSPKQSVGVSQSSGAMTYSYPLTRPLAYPLPAQLIIINPCN